MNSADKDAAKTAASDKDKEKPKEQKKPVNLFVHNNAIYEAVSDGSLVRYVKRLELTPLAKLEILWRGAKIPYEYFRQTAAFMAWIEEEHQSEGMVRFFYNDQTREWRVEAMPQTLHKYGMTVKDELDPAIFGPLAGEGFVQFGDLHSHRNASAFASGGDKSDENTNPGVHITLGKIKENIMDIHIRVTTNNVEYDTSLCEWFCLPAECTGIPKEFEELILKHYMLKGVDKEKDTFPEVWKSRCKTYTYTYGGTGYQQFQQGGRGGVGPVGFFHNQGSHTSQMQNERSTSDTAGWTRSGKSKARRKALSQKMSFRTNSTAGLFKAEPYVVKDSIVCDFDPSYLTFDFTSNVKGTANYIAGVNEWERDPTFVFNLYPAAKALMEFMDLEHDAFIDWLNDEIRFSPRIEAQVHGYLIGMVRLNPIFDTKESLIDALMWLMLPCISGEGGKLNYVPYSIIEDTETNGPKLENFDLAVRFFDNKKSKESQPTLGLQLVANTDPSAETTKVSVPGQTQTSVEPTSPK